MNPNKTSSIIFCYKLSNSNCGVEVTMISITITTLFNHNARKSLVQSNIRFFSIHEYSSMKILKDAGINVINGVVARSPEEAFNFAKKSNFRDFVVKAQVLAGGRSRGHFLNGFQGGVHMAYDAESVREIASKMVGSHLITKQTGKDGLPCNMVYIVERLYPRREFYIAFALDRQSCGPILMACGRGGVNIEEVAEKDPEAIIRLPIDIDTGLNRDDAKEVLRKIQFSPELIDEASEELIKLYDVFRKTDMLLLEVNPFCETNDGRVLCMDCKIQVDDNALFRQKEIAQLRDRSQENELDALAVDHHINYIKLTGDIGCLVNGAGLAMATMDILQLHGGSAANFLDIGGTADIPQIVAAFDILRRDENVNVIFVNIFGGIMRGDIVANGIKEAKKQMDIQIPIIVRLRGTNSKEGLDILKENPDGLLFVEDYDDASKLAVKIANINALLKESNLEVTFKIKSSN